MKKIETELLDCFILEPDRFGDERGYFSPYFIQKNFDELGFERVVQANRSKSSKGVLRGLHFQEDPKCQAKIVEVIKGAAIDVVVDIRKDSETYGKHIAVELNDQNNRQLFVPRGFAHGFVSLEDDTIFQYLIDNDYAIAYPYGDFNENIRKITKDSGIKMGFTTAYDYVYPGDDPLELSRIRISRDDSLHSFINKIS